MPQHRSSETTVGSDHQEEGGRQVQTDLHTPTAALGDAHAEALSGRNALIVLALSVGFFIALVPFAKVPLPAAAWFIPLNQSVLIVNDVVTATLLFGQLSLSRSRAVLVLAVGYAFSALMAIAHLLSFPGLFAPAGLLAGGAHSTAYLFLFWHTGFPVCVLVYALLRMPTAKVSLPSTIGLTHGLAACVFLVLGLTWLAVAGEDLLPPLMDGNHYSPSFNVFRFGPWIVTAFAFAVLWRQRKRSILDIWLVVVLAAWFFEIGLAAIFNAGRYDVGFYAGRAYALLASSFVLIMLLTEQGRIYRQLAQADETTRSEAALRESRAVLGLAMQGGRMGAWSRDLRDRTAWWSPELEAILGLSPGSLPTKAGALVELVHPDDRAAIQQAFDDAQAEGADISVEFRVRHADGPWLWVDGRGRVAHADGRPTKVFGIVIDIGARKRAEEASSELEARFQTLADGMPQLAWMARSDGWIEWYNRRWYEYTGTTPQEMEGWGWQGVHDPNVLPEVLDRWKAAIAAREPFEMVFPLRGGDGQFRSFLTRVSPLKDSSGEVLHWFGTNTDISSQRAAEEALRASDRRKDEFLATLAHELRNPLAPIRNTIELLDRAGPLPPHVERARALLDRQSKQLVRLVDDLLDISRITQGKVHLRREEVSLVRCLEDALQTVRHSLDAAGYEVMLNIGPDPLYANADPTRVCQAFANLLSNAVKFTPRGGRIFISAAAEGGSACIRITDSGVGIAPEHLVGIFEMFSQVAQALAREQGGLGVGLALVRGLVELHGGSVEAQSEGIGRGSTFVVRLPLLAQREDSAIESNKAASNKTSRKVLVVDDNQDAASALRALLEIEGHSVCEAHDGREGLRLAVAFEPDVVLLDIGMPGMNGLEVARELRKWSLGTRVLIIAVTGWGQAHERELTREAGFDFHLTKPLDYAVLEQLLATGRNLPRSARGEDTPPKLH